VKHPPITVAIFAALLVVLRVRDAHLIWRGEFDGLGGSSRAAWISLVLGVIALCGIYAMRRWAVVAILAGQTANAVHWSMTPELWRDKFPVLGPALPWVWLAIWAALLLPHWRRMTWRFP
jgi:hypothetical protein